MAIFNSEEFFLREGRTDVNLVSYCASTSPEIPFNEKRKALLVIPGGGYEMCSDREAEPIALAFVARGYNAFVLRYSIKENAKYPAPLIDACLAVKLIKENAERFNIDPEFVFAIGFSAGAHLAGMLSTMWHRAEVKEAIGVDNEVVKIRGAILSYPVVCAGKYAHRGSINRILGMTGTESAPEELLDMVSIDKNVDERTCPMFIWHTATDTGVPVQNSILLAKELADKKIPFEMHIYPIGWHGLSLATKQVQKDCKTEFTQIAGWVDDAAGWLDKI